MAIGEEYLLSLKVDDAEALQNIANLATENEKLKKSLTDLADAYKKGDVDSESYYKQQAQLKAQMAENNAGIRENTKELKTNAAAVSSADTSINGMRARVADLQKTWNSLSDTARESDVGKQIQSEMNSLNTSINDANISVGNFKDNIGNYPQIMGEISLSNTKAGRAMDSLGLTVNTTAQAFAKNMVGGLRAVGAQMTALMANPLIAIMAGIAAIVMTIVAAIKRSDDALTALQVAFAPITDFIDFVLEAVGKIAVGVAKAFEYIATLGGTVETSGQQAVRLMDKIEDMRRENVLQEAKDEQALALAKEKYQDKENYTTEQRKKALLDVQKIEDARAKRKEDIARAELKQFQLENAHNKSTDEYKDREAELTANILKSETERAANNRFILRSLNGITAEQKAQEEQSKKANEEIHKQYLANLAERVKKEKEAIQKTQDLRIEVMKDGQDKELALLDLKHSRDILSLKERLKNEKNLTAKAKSEINEQIKLLDEKFINESGNIRIKYMDQTLEKVKQLDLTIRELLNSSLESDNEDAEASFQIQLENLRNFYDDKLAIAEMNGEDLLKEQKANLDRQRKQELSAKNLTEEQKAAINKKYKLAEQKAEVASLNGKLSVMGELASAVADAAGEGTTISKIAASTGVTINAIQGGIAAVVKGIEQLGPVAGPIVGGATAAALAVSAAKSIGDIWATNGSSKSVTPTTVSASSGSGSTTYTNLPNLGSVYPTGADQSEVTQQIMLSTPTPVVRVTEITEMQNSVKVKENSKI